MYTPIDRTDRLIQRLCKDGYLVRNRETDGGEEVIEYMVGPRGKIEVGESGVAGLVREVYGRPGPTTTTGEVRNGTQQNEEEDEFERRLERSLAASRRERVRGADAGDEPPDEGRANRRSQPNRRITRARATRDDDDE